MTSSILHRRSALALMILLFGMIPPFAYWVIAGRVANVTPRQAIELLNQPASDYVLIDVRPSGQYAAEHLDGAVSWPYETLVRDAGSTIPQTLRGKHLLVYCASGLASVRAVRVIRRATQLDAASVHGGMDAWIAQAPDGSRLGCRLRNLAGDLWNLPYRESSRVEQWAALSNFWAVKPFYMLLSLVLVLLLLRARARDLVALRWALLFFFLGEAFCAANFFAFQDASYLSEYLHSFGMVLSFAFVTFAVFEGLDQRIIKYSDPDQKCAALGLCHFCLKYADAPCGLKRLFLFAILACIVLCLLPLNVKPYTSSYNTRILWYLYNYSHPVIYQLYELYWCPLSALPLFAAGFAVLYCGKGDPVSPAKIIFAAGMGFLGFSFFRLFLFTPFRDNLAWFQFWEEITELIYITGVAFLLWTFRRSLLGRAADS